MKSAGPHLVFFALVGSIAAQAPAPPPRTPAKTSSRLRQEINVLLPRYTPPPYSPAPAPAPAPDEDPNVLSLPKFTVKEYRPRDHDPDAWLNGRGLQQKTITLYRRSLTDLEWALNSWHLPIVGTSPEARAAAAYRARKALSESQRVHRLFSLVSLNDPAAAQNLEKERVRMEQAEYWQSRPAGHGRSK